MPDQTGLRFIGLGFSAVTAAVALIAAFIVISATPELGERPAIASVIAR
jgi:hypothetical protein